MGLVTRSLFVGGGVTYPPRYEILISIQVPTGERETDRHIRALVKRTNHLAIQRFRSLTNWIIHGLYDFVCRKVRKQLP